MKTELITRRPDLLVRRIVLAPGEAMPWHRDACHRFSVVVRGDLLAIEYRDSDERIEVPVHAGMADWDEPHDREHRAVNIGVVPYEEVVMFFLDPSDSDPQPGFEWVEG